MVDVNPNDVVYMSYLDYDEPLGRVNKHNKEWIIEWNKKHFAEHIEKLKVAAEIYEKAGVKDWWVDCGTLLGCWRNNKFIPHDLDIDTAYVGDKSVGDRISKVIKEYGKDTRCLDIREHPKQDNFCMIWKNMGKFKTAKPNPKDGDSTGECFEEAGNFVDFYSYYLDGRENVRHDFAYNTLDDSKTQKNIQRLKDILPVKKTVLEGVEVNIPNDAEKYLEEFYGYLGHDYYYCQKTQKYKKIGS